MAAQADTCATCGRPIELRECRGDGGGPQWFHKEWPVEPWHFAHPTRKSVLR